MAEPTHDRIAQKNGTTKSLKMSMGKKMLHAKENEALARGLYTYMIINGVQYCRRHLMVRCHLCEVDATYTRDEVNEDRSNLGLRRGGDVRLNERAERWHEEILAKQFEARIKIDTMNAMYGQGTYERAEQFQQMKSDSKADEREINDRFLKENDDILKNKGASTCCYWACQTQDGISDKPLLRCTGCGIVKYCCKEHQKQDWLWEHKGECAVSVPAWFREEMEQDRQRNLNGDYSDYKI